MRHADETRVAAPPGFEPRRTEPESVMLPFTSRGKVRLWSADLLPRQGSNLNWANQNRRCCQLHHEAIGSPPRESNPHARTGTGF